MLSDSQYLQKNFRVPEIEHKYGENIHILSDPYLFTLLGRLGSPPCKQPLINQLLDRIYRELVRYVVNNEFPQTECSIETRMKDTHHEGVFKGLLIDPNTRVVSVNLARAGTTPSAICFDAFNYILNPDLVRQDHISINRETNAKEEVVGTKLGGVKIGGDVENAFVIFPDPMGATGSTILKALDIYKKEIKGTAKKFVAIHLIVTPEYLKAVVNHHPDTLIYALRLDRGLSKESVLQSIPGTHWDEEQGLNEKHYIVPGAGGMGEVINNSYV